MKKYRIVFFEPVAGSGWRIPVAALLSEPGQPGAAVAAEQLPDANCVGGPAQEGLLRYGLRFIKQTEDIQSLPSVLGDQFLLGSEMVAPSAVPSLSRWIRENVLPRRVDADTRAGHEKRPTIGFRALSRVGISHYVRKAFRMDIWTEGRVSRSLVRTATHWVRTNDGALLLEPITCSTADPAKEIQEVFSKWTSYREAKKITNVGDIDLATYLVPESSASHRYIKEARDVLSHVSTVYDIGSSSERESLVMRVKKTGIAAGPQQLLA